MIMIEFTVDKKIFDEYKKFLEKYNIDSFYKDMGNYFSVDITCESSKADLIIQYKNELMELYLRKNKIKWYNKIINKFI
jgi:hypothetical protein